MNAASWFRNNQPHTIQVVPIFLWVVWGQYSSWWGREVEKTWDYKEEVKKEKEKKRKKKVKFSNSWVETERQTLAKNKSRKERKDNKKIKYVKKQTEETRAQTEICALTDTTGFVARPLIVVLACDGSFSHEFKGRLAKEGQHIAMLKSISTAATERGHPGIATTSSLDLCNAPTRTVMFLCWSSTCGMLHFLLVWNGMKWQGHAYTDF